MKFINPLDLLSINVRELNGKDLGNEVKKAKQRRASEIEFSDNGYIVFGSQEITKNDLNKYADLLSDLEKREYYLFLAENQALSQFLQSGETSIFKNFRQEAMYKDKGFVSFISPFFAESYGLAYVQALKKQDKDLLQKMNNQVSLITKEDFEKASQKTKEYLEQLTRDVKQLGEEIDNEESIYNDSNIAKLPQNILVKINGECINLVSNYLQTQRNQLAQALRNLSVSVFNAFDNDVVAFAIINLATAIQTDGLVAKNISEAYEQLSEIHTDREQARKYQPQLDKYGAVIAKLVQLIEKAENQRIKFDIGKLLSDNDIRELNSLPDNVFTQIRNQVALAFVSLSVAIWEHHQDLDFTYSLAQTAQKITVDAETKGIVRNSFSQIQELKNGRDLLEKYKSNIDKLQSIVSKVENKGIAPSSAYSEVSKIIPITQLNNEGSQANELKDAFCHLLSNLSVAIFNEFHDFDNALNVLNIGKQINVSSEGRRKIDANHRQLSQMKVQEYENIKQQLLQVIGVFSNMYSQIRNTDIDNINQDQVIKVFRDILSRDVVDFVANATTHTDLQIQLFDYCKNITAKLKKKYALAAIDCFQGIGNRNGNLASRISQFRAEQENRSSGFWGSIFGS